MSEQLIEQIKKLLNKKVSVKTGWETTYDGILKSFDGIEIIVEVKNKTTYAVHIGVGEIVEIKPNNIKLT